MPYRRINLEHAAASAENLMLAAFVLVMLAIPLLGLALPQAAIGGIHPVSILMLLAYLQGMRMVSQTHKLPMWLPRHTRETRTAADSGSIPGTAAGSATGTGQTPGRAARPRQATGYTARSGQTPG